MYAAKEPESEKKEMKLRPNDDAITSSAGIDLVISPANLFV